VKLAAPFALRFAVPRTFVPSRNVTWPPGMPPDPETETVRLIAEFIVEAVVLTEIAV
jgi:hypothetical protein